MTLATEKVQCLLPEEALKAVRERSRCTGKRGEKEKQGGKEVEVVVSDTQEGSGVQEVLMNSTEEFETVKNVRTVDVKQAALLLQVVF